MRRLRFASLALLMAIGVAACASDPVSPPRISAPPATSLNKAGTDAGSEAGEIVTATITYRRPREFQSAGRPSAIYVIADYRHASESDEYPGSWDDQGQALSATVSVPLRAENLIYVVDAALQPGVATPMSAARGTLKEIPCPSGVDPLRSCYLLQVLR